jgi:hypothetical protein
MENMLERWAKSTRSLPDSLTTKDYLPEDIRSRLLLEDASLEDRLVFEELPWKGLDILKNLQSRTKRNCLTLYRAIRFPTFARTHETVTQYGLSMSNYEQERILAIYDDPNYREIRSGLDSRFLVPQERVIPGVPVFGLVNDAVQIHRAFRSDKDRVLITSIHIPKTQLDCNIDLIANSAIDIDHRCDDRDYSIRRLVERDGYYYIDYAHYRTLGLDIYEMYLQGVGYNMGEHNNLGIEQRFYLLDIEKINRSLLKAIQEDPDLKKKQQYLRGFFGEQNIFGRRPATHLPLSCYEVTLK